MKTYENWKSNLEEYLSIGDQVDEEMVNYFINVLPPACYRSDCIQMGEPSFHTSEGKATYPTLKRTGENWTWAGACYRGETITREDNRIRV